GRTTRDHRNKPPRSSLTLLRQMAEGWTPILRSSPLIARDRAPDRDVIDLAGPATFEPATHRHWRPREASTTIRPALSRLKRETYDAEPGSGCTNARRQARRPRRIFV